MYEKAEQDNLDILITNIIFDYPSKKLILNDLNLDEDTTITGKEYMNIFFKNNKNGFTVNKLIKKDLYLKNNLFYNEKIFLLEDMELIGRIGYFARKVGKLNKEYYHYIQKETNGSQRVKLKNLTDRIEAYRSLIEFYKKYNEEEIVKEIKKERDIALISEIVGKDFYKLDGYDEVLEKIIKILKEDKNNIKGKLNCTKYQILTVKCIKKIKFISPKIQIKVFKFISKLKNILKRSTS